MEKDILKRHIPVVTGQVGVKKEHWICLCQVIPKDYKNTKIGLLMLMFIPFGKRDEKLF